MKNVSKHMKMKTNIYYNNTDTKNNTRPYCRIILIFHITPFNLGGMLSNSFITSSLLMACHSSLVNVHNSSDVFDSLLLTLVFKTNQRFSIILKSGDWAGQSLTTQMLRRFKKSNVDWDLWHGAPS